MHNLKPEDDNVGRQKRTKTSPFAKTLQAIMREQGLTIRKTAQMAGVSPSTIDDWRSGAMPADYLSVQKLATALGVSFEFLLTGKHPVETKNILSVTEVFEDGGALFDGYAKITIQRLVPRGKA